MMKLARSLPEATRCARLELEESRARRFVALCEAHGLPKPIREAEVIPGRRHRYDFVWYDERLLLEVDGGVWMKAEDGKGAHSRPANILRDQEKLNLATLHGWRLLRVQPRDLLQAKTLELIRRVIEGGRG